MEKIFISHSSIDENIAKSIVSFLKEGIGIDKNSIFCSSVSGVNIKLGVNFNDYILSQLTDEKAVVIALITNSYFNSKFCLYEMGAAWGLCRTIIPVLFGDMKYGDLQDFIKHTQAIQADDKAGVNQLADHIRNTSAFKNDTFDQNTYEEKRDVFLSTAKSYKLEEAPKNKIEGNIPNYKYKAVVFDFDGTVLHGDNFKYSWKEVWAHLNYEDSKRIDLVKKHQKENESYSCQDWCNDCAKYFIDRNFNKKHVSEILKKRNLTLAPGFETVVKLLKNFGFKIAIISGGISTFYEESVPDNIQQLIDEVYINEFEYEHDGRLKNIVAYQKSGNDTTGKVFALNDFCKKYNIKPKDVVFVGEGTNDIDVAEQAGLAFVFPSGGASSDPYKNLSYVHQLNDDDLTSLLSEVLVL